MKAVILAAGFGSRLRPLTLDVPKCMIEVNGIPIIKKQLDNLISNKIEDIYIVTGYKNDILSNYIECNYKNSNINIIWNRNYENTNNMYSLYLASKYIKNNNFVLMNGDVFFEGSIIKALIHNDYDSLIVCEKNKYLEESMKVSVNGGYVNSISKALTEKNSYGTSIDIYKFGSKACEELFKIIEIIIEKENNKNLWTEEAIDRLVKIIKVKTLDIKYNWVEIDNFEDLKYAETLF